ncbi:MAG: sulfotransferase [Candidatus Binatia bacterium]
MAVRRKEKWRPAPRPEWVARINEEGRHMDIDYIVPLDEESLLHSAKRKTGLSDFGGTDWIEPFRIMMKAIAEEAALNLMGRLMARSDILMMLENRLLLTEFRKRHPEVAAEEIRKPVFIIGLSRSGTSILFEILSQDPGVRVPKYWEALFPCPLEGLAADQPDPRIERADALVKQWSRVAPEYATMHENAALLPCECGYLMTSCFIADHLGAIHQVPSYNNWLAQADLHPAYRFHRELLQALQWKERGKHWLLKGPWHIGNLRILFEIYPDACVVQTHRDPIKSMSSTTSILGTIAWMRSDRPFDSDSWDELMEAEGNAARLEAVMRERDAGVIPSERICDVLYKDIVGDPIGIVRRVYDQFGMELTNDAIARMRAYIAAKPQGKFGKHTYDLDSAEDVSKERAVFRRYQERYGIPSET